MFEIVEGLVIDLAGAMQPDQFGPPRFYRSDDDVEMASDRAGAFFRGTVECLACGGARAVATKKLRMDEFSVGVMCFPLDRRELRAKHRVLGSMEVERRQRSRVFGWTRTFDDPAK